MSMWERRDGEPAMWYDRFEVYRVFGPPRTIDAAYRICTGQQSRAGSSWWRRAKEWEWAARAEAWDLLGWKKQAVEEEVRRKTSRERRLRLLGEAREVVWRALSAARIADLGQEDARSKLSSLRLFFGDVMRLERMEMGEGQSAQVEEFPQVDAEIAEILDRIYGDDDEAGSETG